jgi:multiple sugar transport system ATP-binding protein
VSSLPGSSSGPVTLAATAGRPASGVEFDQVVVTFPDGTTALKALDLAISDGEFVVLVGPSGCGKSTALRALAGLQTINAGTIRIGGRDVTDLDPQARDIAMVFQNYALYPHKNVYENLAYPLRVHGMPGAEVDRLVRQTADQLALTPYLQRKPRALSGGQRQRVAMGRALVRKPAAFLMDEPLSNLDAALRIEMRTEILSLHRRIGVSTIYVTHDQVEAMTMGDRVAVLRAGVLQQFDTPKALYERPVNVFVAAFIGSPAINLAFAQFDESSATLVLFGQRLALRHAAKYKSARATVVLGIRPEAFAYAPNDAHDIPLEVTPRLVEFLGSEILVHFSINPNEQGHQNVLAVVRDEDNALAKIDGVTIGKSMMIARLDARCPAEPNQKLTLWASSSMLQLFDVKTGATLGCQS